MKNIILTLALCFLVSSGCDEDQFLIEDPQTALYATNIYNTHTGFKSSMNAVYAFMRLIYSGGDTRTRDQLWVQNADNVTTRTSSINQFFAVSAGWSEVNNVFDWLYKIINSTNMIINRADGDVDWEGTSAEENLKNKELILGQAHVARAWAYRLLIYAFGPVPLSTEEITGENYSNAWDRTSIDEIKQQMKKDLLIGLDYLEFLGDTQIQFNGAATRHYLGELYLSLGEFQNAVDILQALCTSGEYKLINNRFGRTSDNIDGNHFIDMFRSPYRIDGNTESIFVFANGANIPGYQKFTLMNSYIGEFQSYERIAKTPYWYEQFGGQARCRYLNTPYSMFNEADYERYTRLRGKMADPRTNPHYIHKWLWNNADGRPNYMYEMNDIRGDQTSIRRYFVYDWNENGKLTDASIPVDTALYYHADVYDRKDEDNKYIGDTIYTFFSYKPSIIGSLEWHEKHTYTYSRKWEVEMGYSTWNWGDQSDCHTVVHLRLADSYLLYAEALFMNGNSSDAALWINKVRERSGASTVDASDISLDFILDERSRELVSEELRRITLLRMGKYLERTRKYNPLTGDYVQDYHKLWPFPGNAIDANKEKVMDQNLGYGGATTCDFSPAGYPDE